MTHGSRGHEDGRQSRVTGAAICLALLMSGHALADGSVPWAEKAVRDHVDFTDA